jgi:hypothetical protein
MVYALGRRGADLLSVSDEASAGQILGQPDLPAATLRRTAAYLRRLRRTAEAPRILGSPLPPIATELRQVADYCGR